MRITEIRDLDVPLTGGGANALVDLSHHHTSLVAVVSDVRRNGRPVTGLAFGSIGRFGQSGILRQRMIPRVLAEDADALIDAATGQFSPQKVLATAMRGEKPGGHGDRSVAAAALELAVWDLDAKLADEPAHVAISRHFDTTGAHAGVPVYAAGGYYRPGKGVAGLEEEFRAFRDAGFTAFKMKVGGLPLRGDLERVEAVLGVVGGGAALSVDANGRFGLADAVTYAEALAPYELRWFEEPGDPLDFETNRLVAERYPHPIATGENLFSLPDVTNLLRYGGMRPGRDVFQMDAGLSYGLTEYARMLTAVEAGGHPRSSVQPHGGHLINLHIAVGLGLGGCEVYPTVFAPAGGFADTCAFDGGRVAPSDAPGFGLEEKRGLASAIERITS